MNKYFIKDNYIENKEVNTYDSTDEINYWNKERIHISTVFQYYVYKLGSYLIKQNKLNSFLDIGCGPAIKVQKLIKPYCENITLFDQPNTEQLALNNVPTAIFYGIDIEKDDININQEFDVIICADVIEHLFEPDKCLNIAKRHMGKESILILSTPERDNLRGKECNTSGNIAHVREWNKMELKMYIKNNGFSIKRHYTMPQKLLTPYENIIYKTIGLLIKPKRWNNCQVIICKIDKKTQK